MGDEDFQFRTVLSIQLQLSGQELTQVSNSSVNTQKMPFGSKQHSTKPSILPVTMAIEDAI